MSQDINFRLLPLGPFGDGLVVECPSCGDHALFGPVVEEVFRQYIQRILDGAVVEDCTVREFIG